MKKFLALFIVAIFALEAPVLARTKYDKYGHKITPQKKIKVQAAAKVDNEKKVKIKDVEDGRGRSLGRAVRNGDTDNFTMYNQRGRKTGTYVEDKNGNGKYYDLRGREVRVRRQTQDIE